MFSIIKRVLILAEKHDAKRIKWACVFGFFEGIFMNMPIFAMLFVLTKIVDKTIVIKDVWMSGGLIVVGVIGRYITKRIVYVLQCATGYEIFEKERISIGDRFKRFSMGFFNDQKMGDISSVVTTDFTFIEMFAMNTIDKVVNGFSSIIIGCIFLLILDYRIALVSIIVSLLSMIILKKVQRIAKEQSAKKAKVQSKLIASVLEYVQGISVIKAFNMTGDQSKATKESFKETRDSLIGFEKAFIPILFKYENCFSIGIAGTVFLVSSYCMNGTLSMQVMLMMIVFIFELYLPVKALGALTVKIRIMEAGLDRYDAIKNVEIIDENGKDMKLHRFDIAFENVSFAYEQKEIIKDISFKIPQNSMTALVGASGCGKTTIANLIARFWDVQKGKVLVGGVDVKEMTCDSLLSNMSMVFQKVYLFNDTIYNNVKFGKANASKEEIIKACQKARCHEFIMELEDGYDTMIGEGGSTLSGGEKQRISIARAILKDAPIILLDEATASIDPENEQRIQQAINALIKNKTLIVIAHRLSTIKAADQILVLEEGKLVEKGIHDDLLNKNGIYADFWNRRQKARNWKFGIKSNDKNKKAKEIVI
ncbi:MAG: ABC transporter ATP-binding protein/permease [Marinisporobacter sp.]|jgi:ATP-binding cassette subfamily B protein|nr:ABC transporter ATP-binding protein/permease [Marinisporobacter sp.]